MSQEITLENLFEWQNKGIEFQLIDVRTEEEHLEFNIGGTNIPLDEIMKRKQEISNSLPVVFYCAKGVRSTFAIQRLTPISPHPNFYNLSKGIKK
jgi:adenylyltransferase/sulfurtransferase